MMVIYFLLCCVCGEFVHKNGMKLNFLLKMLNCIALYFSLILMWEFLRGLTFTEGTGFLFGEER